MKSATILLVTLVISTLAKFDGDFVTSQWIGLAPLCHNSNDTCYRLGFEYLGSSKFDKTWVLCLTGRTAHCKISGDGVSLEEATKVREDTNTTIKVLAFDADIIPLDEEHWPSDYDGHMERTCRIPKEIFAQYPDTDIIFMQGVYVSGCTEDIPMTNLFAYYGWNYVSHELKFGEPHTSGLLTVTRHPQKTVKQKFFHDKEIENYPKHKYGFNLTETFVHGEKIYLLNAFFEEKDAEVRYKQMQELNELMNENLDAPAIVFSNFGFNLNNLRPLGTKGGILEAFNGGKKVKGQKVETTKFKSSDLVKFCPRWPNEIRMVYDFDMECDREITTDVLVKGKLFKGEFLY